MKPLWVLHIWAVGVEKQTGWKSFFFGSEAIHQLEEIVKQYSVSLYIEAAARNEAAIRLYRKLGYDCLNTITIRKDFPGYEYDVVRKEKIHELEFEIRKDKAL
mgnify:CR=1 FL=1